MQVRRNHQTGSVVSFIAIAIALVLMMAGGIYFVGQRGDQARKDEATKSAEQISQKPATEVPASTPAQPDTSSASNTTVVSADSTNEDLPTTGMGSDMIRILSLGILVASISSFTISRNNLKRSL